MEDLALVPDPDRYVDAACASVPVGLMDVIFFSDTETARRAALAYCRDCPLRQQCLDDALREEQDEPVRHGIRGGLTPKERDAIGLPPRCLDCGGPKGEHPNTRRCDPCQLSRRRRMKRAWERLHAA